MDNNYNDLNENNTSNINDAVDTIKEPLVSDSSTINRISSYVKDDSYDINAPLLNDDDYVKAYIGKHYTEITTGQLNFGALLFGYFYLFYRKRFASGVFMFIIQVILGNFVFNNILLAAPIVNLLIAVLFNTLYVSYVKRQVKKIESANSQASNNEILSLCEKQGGTSIKSIFKDSAIVFLVAAILIAGLTFFHKTDLIKDDLFNPTKWNIDALFGKESIDTDIEEAILDADIEDYFHVFQTATIKLGGVEYDFDIREYEVFELLYGHKDEIKFDLYYIIRNNEKVFTKYKAYVRLTGEDITSITSENELRRKLGEDKTGIFTKDMKVEEIGSTGFLTKDSEKHAYVIYVLIDSEDKKYEMRYIIDKGNPNIEVGKTYSFTYEVTDGKDGFEYTINSYR